MVNIAKGSAGDSLAIYTPSADQEKLRAIFQCYLEDNPIDQRPFDDRVRSALEPQDADRVIKLADLNPQFKRWFMTGHLEWRVRLKLLEQKSMSALEEVLACTDPKSSAARVNAAKYLLSLSGKTEKTAGNPAEKLEQAISQMSEIELKALMESEDGSETSVEIKRTNKSKKIINVTPED